VSDYSDWIDRLAVEYAGRPVQEAMRAAVARMGTLTVCSVCEQEAKHVHLRGTMWLRRGTLGPSMSFCRTLVGVAGGIERLLSEWDQVDWDGKPVAKTPDETRVVDWVDDRK